MFSVLLISATYLLRLTNLFVEGIDITTVLQLSAYYSPSLIVKAFPMAMLLAALLAFAKLSNDSEIVAAMAGGANFISLMRPVVIFGLIISCLTFAFGETIVPEASKRANELQSVVVTRLKGLGATPFYQPLVVDQKLRGGLMASDIAPANDAMYNVTGVWYREDFQPAWLLFAREIFYSPMKEWRIRDGTIYYLRPTGITTVSVAEAGPPPGSSFDFTPQDILARKKLDFDTMSMAEIGEQIKRRQAELATLGNKDARLEQRIRELQVAYWNKISLPLTCLVFALIGAPSAIRRTRQSFGVGIALSVAIIFVFYMIQTYLIVIAKGGVISPMVGSFLPVALGLAAAFFLFWSKSR